MKTFDGKLQRVGPGEGPSYDVLWPRRHGRWWNWDKNLGRTKTADELYQGFKIQNETVARETLAHVEAIAQSAVERAAAADRRATLIAGSVTIATSFTLSGAALVLDRARTDPIFQRWLAVELCATTIAFALAAVYALRALVSTRKWNWSNPRDLPIRADPLEERIGKRAAHLLYDFAGNWEISVAKNRNVGNALVCLLAGLFGVTAIAATVAMHSW